MSERRIYQLLAHYRAGGMAALETLSRRPKTNPNQTKPEVIVAIK
jgi:hypothetical protein